MTTSMQMDDDLTFGTSVWGTPSDPVPPPHQEASSLNAFPTVAHDPVSDVFDDFDDFGASVQTASAEGENDDFGDFGDAQGEESQPFGDDEFEQEVPMAGPSQTNWEPLRLDPMPSRAELVKQVNDILAPIWGNDDISQVTTQEGIREAEGISQILVTPGSRNLYNMLMQPPPPLKPPNWKQSRMRRQHLIALGIPVNLDEVLPRANGKPLPPLQITTRPASVPPESKITQRLVNASESSRTGTPRSGTPLGQRGPIQSPFGPKPDLDEEKISEVLGILPETLTLLPVATLERHLADIRTQTAQTSSMLKYLLQTREALQQDSETYNKLIAELVGEAQKMKSGRGRPPVGKRGS